jgi:hypothetical protein
MHLPTCLSRAPVTVLSLCLTIALVGPGCGSDPSTATDDSTGAATTGQDPVNRTDEFDAIGVIGSSSATGANSTGQGGDVRATSWATGDNPEVNSIYLRLLPDHPALEGHNVNAAVDGSAAPALLDQARQLLESDPVPDLVLVNSIDNDIRCDGSDPDNYDAFEAAIDELLTFLEESAPGTRVFFVDQWSSVVRYNDVVSTLPGGIEHLTDNGPCGAFREDGTRNPEGEAYLQQQVDEYMARIISACGRHDDCATDKAALQELALEAADLAPDFDHLSVTGLAKEAAIAWEALPSDWK